ncbi:MAG: hypothetical protein BWY28_01721 [bacterium ADurb.Bin236]|nr:MAG: hypothetical protein BWY28_01721 [bacterium ADurb.Bin236]HOY63616.1 hypothetical protein [bacterium]
MNNFWKIVIGAAAAATASYMVSSGVKKSQLKKQQARESATEEESGPAAAQEPEILDKRPGHKMCSGCGEKVAEYDFFCPACGSPMDAVAAAGDRAENRV